MNENKFTDISFNQIFNNHKLAVITTIKPNKYLFPNINTNFLDHDDDIEIFSDNKNLYNVLYLKTEYSVVDRKNIIRQLISKNIKIFVFIGNGYSLQSGKKDKNIIISDHINCSGQNPLIGQNNDNFGVRFPDVTDLYSKKIRNTILTNFPDQFYESILFIPKTLKKFTNFEQNIVDKNNLSIISKDIYAETITAKHAGCESVGIILFDDKINLSKIISSIIETA